MSKCHDKMTNKNAKNLNVNNHGKGAVGQKNRVLPSASVVGVGGNATLQYLQQLFLGH